MISLIFCTKVVFNNPQLSKGKKVHIFISPPRYRPKDFYTNRMGCQNSYKEAEIENKLSAQSCRSQKTIGGNDKKK